MTQNNLIQSPEDCYGRNLRIKISWTFSIDFRLNSLHQIFFSTQIRKCNVCCTKIRKIWILKWCKKPAFTFSFLHDRQQYASKSKKKIVKFEEISFRAFPVKWIVALPSSYSSKPTNYSIKLVCYLFIVWHQYLLFTPIWRHLFS